MKHQPFIVQNNENNLRERIRQFQRRSQNSPYTKGVRQAYYLATQTAMLQRKRSVTG